MVSAQLLADLEHRADEQERHIAACHELLRKALNLLDIAEAKHLAATTAWRFHVKRLQSDYLEELKRFAS